MQSQTLDSDPALPVVDSPFALQNLEAVTDEMGQAVSEPSTPPKEGKVADPVAVQDEPLSGEVRRL